MVILCEGCVQFDGVLSGWGQELYTEFFSRQLGGEPCGVSSHGCHSYGC